MWASLYTTYEFLVLLSVFVSRICALHIPQNLWRNNPPEMCRTNVTLPSYPESCFLKCDRIHWQQDSCLDAIPCMCRNIEPVAISECLQCILDTAGDLLLLIPDDLQNTSLQVSAYTDVCSKLSPRDSKLSNNDIRQECEIQGLALSYKSLPHSRISLLSKFYPFFPLLSMFTALVFIFLYFWIR
ncbi:hypothetical protein BDZ97DRAFT_1821337 [Flammula alnicola]|nr:hypothetical protein BDZ97DRAFT_1821337 [Flammula alnicola]